MQTSTPRRAYRRTKAEQTELGDHVVRVCLSLFAQGGYEAISMRKLASEVGVAPMSLYRYFPTKAHLMRHVWDDILCRAVDQARAAASKRSAPVERLRAFANGFLDYWLENRSHYWVVFAIREDLSALHADDASNVLRPNTRLVLEEVEQLVQDCIAAHTPVLRLGREPFAELLFQRLLGFLLGVIGVGSVPWPEVVACKDALLDSIEHQLRCFFRRHSPA